MKELSAVKFRIILYAITFIVAAGMVSAFVFGYRYLQTVGVDTKKRQADATASEDSIANLEQMRLELAKRADVTDKLNALRSSNTLPQFDTEKSLRTIARQLGLQVKSISFIDGGSTPASGSQQQSPASGSSGASGAKGASQGAAATGSWGGSRNSRISFEFSGAISYKDFLRFLDAIETATPKLRVESVNLPSGSNRSSVNPGTLVLEMATM